MPGCREIVFSEKDTREERGDEPTNSVALQWSSLPSRPSAEIVPPPPPCRVASSLEVGAGAGKVTSHKSQVTRPPATPRHQLLPSSRAPVTSDNDSLPRSLGSADSSPWLTRYPLHSHNTTARPGGSAPGACEPPSCCCCVWHASACCYAGAGACGCGWAWCLVPVLLLVLLLVLVASSHALPPVPALCLWSDRHGGLWVRVLG